MLFWFEVYEENPDSEDMQLKKGGRSILIAFANNGLFFDTTPKLSKRSFLKG